MRAFMALLGISPEIFFVAGALDLIYQFRIHTRLIPKLGWLEKVLVTPSAHRVHHGSNAVYLIWFRPTGWRPEDVARQYPLPGRDDNYQNYDAKPNSFVGVYVAIHFVLNSLFGFAYLAIGDAQSVTFNLFMGTMFIVQLALISRLLENKPQALLLESIRLIAILATAYVWSIYGLLSSNANIVLLSGVLVSFIVAVLALRSNTRNEDLAVETSPIKT